MRHQQNLKPIRGALPPRPPHSVSPALAQSHPPPPPPPWTLLLTPSRHCRPSKPSSTEILLLGKRMQFIHLPTVIYAHTFLSRYSAGTLPGRCFTVPRVTGLRGTFEFATRSCSVISKVLQIVFLFFPCTDAPYLAGPGAGTLVWCDPWTWSCWRRRRATRGACWRRSAPRTSTSPPS